MIGKYSEFITESLILESEVIYSNLFRQALSKLDSPISKSLLDIENKDFNIQSNYFDINKEKNDEVSFISDRKAQEILKDAQPLVRFTGSGGGWLKHSESNAELFGKLGYQPNGPEPHKPSSSELGVVVKKVVSETSGNTYVWVKFRNAEGVEIGEGVYNQEKLRDVEDPRLKEVWSKNRQPIKIGRAIRALLKVAGVDFVDKDIEDFVNKYKSTIDKINDKFRLFEVVEGDDIAHWYRYANYLNQSGTLGNSCMKSVPSSYFEIYTSNPDVCKLLILKSEDDESKITGRALLWTLTDGKKFLDRIYTNVDSDVQLFRDWAKENGIYSKFYNNSSDSPDVFDLEGQKLRLEKLEVRIRRGSYDRYPYVDTIKYFSPDKGILSNRKSYDNYTLESTGGDAIICDYCDGSGRTTCSNCDGDGDVDCYECDGNGDSRCGDCYGEGTIDCSNCDGSGNIEDSDGNEEACPDCNGDGNIRCDECSGDGRIECSYCDGRGRVECGDCDGNGDMSCPECG